MTNWDLVVSGEELDAAAATRKQTEEKVSKVKLRDLPVYEENGWVRKNESKDGKTFSMTKPKSPDEVFENEVWMLLYKMGFTRMNKDNSFSVDLGGNSKQIDVFAMDDETCIFVECKSSETFEKSKSFKTELEAINGYYSDLVKAVKNKYGDNYKFKYIFATKNYLITESSADMNRMKTYDIAYFDYDTVLYYLALADHLGKAARYQLLGNLFKNTEIKNLENRVYALNGKMGDTSYYMFSIEPERLLKMSYVLHRTKANKNLMPTYQRLIKKERLKGIRDFVNGGGFFPNSIIVSVDTNGNDLRFEPFPAADINSPVKGGVLYLPKHYRSMYVIDGQHRLYGYSETEYAGSNVVPVVAFVDMCPDDQVKMFMDINENQKAVSKSLRNTLSIDLQWKSTDAKKRKEALMLRIAEDLGEDKDSPLYKRVLTGEDKATDRCCITTEYLKEAIKDSRFLNEYSKNAIKRVGTFDKNDNDLTEPFLEHFISKCLKSVTEYCDDEWNAGAKGYLAINNTAYALIRIIDDIVNIQLKKTGPSTVSDTYEMFRCSEDMLLELADVINKLPVEQRSKIKNAKGGSAKKDAWRILQLALNKADPEFINDDLQRYIDEHCTDNHDDSERLLKDLEEHFRKEFKSVISTNDLWINRIPDSLGASIAANVGQENYKRGKSGEPEIDEWYFVSFAEIEKIATYKDNWSVFAQRILSRSQDHAATKIETVEWLRNLAGYKIKLTAGKSLPKADFEELERIAVDFIGGYHASDN